MRGKQGMSPRRERRQGEKAAARGESSRRRERAADARLMELLLAARARMVSLLAVPREAWGRVEHQVAVAAELEELEVCDLALLARLTWREAEVLRLERAGYRAAAVADRLGIARETAKTHLKRGRAKVKAAREQWFPLTSPPGPLSREERGS